MLNLSPYYISFTEKKEVYDIDYVLESAPLGSFLISFMDCDWKGWKNQSEKLRNNHGDIKELINQFADWYFMFRDEMEKTNAILGVFAKVQLMWTMTNVLYTHSIDPDEQELLFLEELREGKIKKGVLTDEHRRDMLYKASETFAEFANIKQRIYDFIESVFLVDIGEDSSLVLEKYKKFRHSETYHTLANIWYRELKPEFRISSIKEANKEAVVSFWECKSLQTVAVLSCDAFVTNKSFLYRCKNCGGIFVPRSKTSCYCDRIAPGQKTKTCKELGPSLEFQKKKDMSEARKLYSRVQNRHRNFVFKTKHYAGRNELYDEWKANADVLLKKVIADEMTYEEFKDKIDVPSSLALSRESIAKLL